MQGSDQGWCMISANTSYCCATPGVKLCIPANHFTREWIEPTVRLSVIIISSYISRAMTRGEWNRKLHLLKLIDDSTAVTRYPECKRGLLIPAPTNPNLDCFVLIIICFLSLFLIPADGFTRPMSSLVTRVLGQCSHVRMVPPNRHPALLSSVFIFILLIHLSCALAPLCHTTGSGFIRRRTR